MVKPSNYAETQTSGDFSPVALGGHYLVIKQVKEQMSSTNKPMIVVLFDFDKNDKQPDYFMESYKNDIRPDKKWSNQATKYVLAVDSENKCSKAFKTFCTCVENSNPGFSCWNGDNLNLEGLKNKKLGGVFGEELDFYNGEVKKKRTLRWFCSTDKVSDAKIPEVTETQSYKNSQSNFGQPNTGFMDIPDGINEDLPFN